MNDRSSSPEIRALPVPQRIALAEQVWASVVEDESQFELTDAQKSELDRRLLLREQNPLEGADWEDVKARILGHA